jgi:cupin fold WbuC family metalloprotein
MKRIDHELIQNLIESAQSSSRGRKNYNIHKVAADPVQRLLNAMEPGSYVQPHKHENPDKRELFVVLRGKMLLIEFNDDGSIHEHQILESAVQNYAAEIAERKFHTVISLQKGSLALEVKDGPYEAADDKNFASWAPKEGDPDCDKYLQGLLDQLNIK